MLRGFYIAAVQPNYINIPNQSIISYDLVGARRALERMLREISDLLGSPMILWLHTWNPWPDNFHEGLEDMYTMMLQYYGLPALSFRGAMYDALQERDRALTYKLFGREGEIHPNCVGTRCAS